VNARLKKFLKDALGIADGLKHRFLVGHGVISGQAATSLMMLCLDRLQISSIGLRNSAIHWKLIERLWWISVPSGAVVATS
jgi:hypothetical protein